MDTPTEWQEMLDGVALTISKYLDTTIQQVDYNSHFDERKKSYTQSYNIWNTNSEWDVDCFVFQSLRVIHIRALPN